MRWGKWFIERPGHWGWRPTQKESALIHDSHLQFSLCNWLIYIQGKQIYLYVKHFRVNNVHTNLGTANSKRFLRKNKFFNTSLEGIIFSSTVFTTWRQADWNHPHLIWWTLASLCSPWNLLHIYRINFWVLLLLEGWLHEKRRFTFGSPRSSKNKPDLKEFLVFFEKIMYLI